MLPLDFALSAQSDPTILCLGAHSDDLEIGACATILGLAERFASARIVWAVFAAAGAREQEARQSAVHCTQGFRHAHIELHQFRDGFFASEIGPLKECFESLKAAWQPDLIFTHLRQDLHQDHRAVSDLTWQTFRNHLILEYEIPKYDGDFGSPNVFCPVPDPLRREKLDILDRYFASQRNKTWFTADTFTGVMRLRGVECNSETGYAEAFYCRKAIVQ